MKKIALLPGGFKPPHGGHYEMAKLAVKTHEPDEMYIIISPKKRDNVTAHMSLSLWQLYLSQDRDDRITPMISTNPSPVGAVYDLLELEKGIMDGSNRDEAILIISEKDALDNRYVNAPKWVEKKNPGLVVRQGIIPVMHNAVSGTMMREMISKSDKTGFKLGLPNHLTENQKELAWTIVEDNITEIRKIMQRFNVI